MADKTILIIGSGLSGLAAGIYARLNGYRTIICEKHDKPGGVCTSWRRKGYTFDGCIHHLSGLSEGSALRKLWQEMGALDNKEMIFPDDLIQIEGPHGQRFTVYRDLDRLESHMKDQFPEDAAAIDEYIAAARKFLRFNMFDLLVNSPLKTAGMLLGNLGAFKWMGTTLNQYAQNFTNPFLRQAFTCVQYDMGGELPMGIHFVFLAGVHKKDFGWPKGGSLEFSRSIARRFEDLGGEIRYRSTVQKILVEADRAVGVRLENGEEIRADTVISAGDGRTAIYNLLDGRYTNPKIDQYYQNPLKKQAFAVHVNLGVNLDLSHEAHSLVLILDQPVEVAGEMRPHLDLEILSYDPSMAPEGKSVIQVVLDSGYEYWSSLKAEGDGVYDAAKQAAAAAVIQALEKRFPGISAQVEVVDVSTPLTIERFTGSWRGLQSWSPPGIGGMLAGVSKTLPGLKNFHMVGQWASGMIGLPNTAAMGRSVVMELCRKDGKKFITSPASAGSRLAADSTL